MIITNSNVNVEKLERITFILKTISHPIRLGIVELLHEHERLSVGEICQKLGSEQSLTSHNLSTMKLKGILSSKREGKKVYYSLKQRSVITILQCLENCECNFVK